MRILYPKIIKNQENSFEAHRARVALPGNVIPFAVCPLAPPKGGACGAGSGPKFMVAIIQTLDFGPLTFLYRKLALAAF
jgi:hypothetical protein